MEGVISMSTGAGVDEVDVGCSVFTSSSSTSLTFTSSSSDWAGTAFVVGCSSASGKTVVSAGVTGPFVTSEEVNGKVVVPGASVD